MTVAGGGRPSAYKTREGARVPSVTTITGRFKESSGLIHWAWNLGINGEDYRKVRDSAADAGHLAHEMIDADIHGRAPNLGDANAETVALASGGFDAFRSWRDQVKLRILDTETPLVSEVHKYGGTRDALAVVNGELVILDWKSGNKIYQEHVVQCAAYRWLEREHGDGSVGGACLLRVGKEMGNYSYNFYPEAVLDLGWQAFERMRVLYDLDAKLKKIVG